MGTGRRRVAALAAGVALAGSAWTGVAAAAPAADAVECQSKAGELNSLFREFAQGQSGLAQLLGDEATGRLEELAGLQTEINGVYAQLVDACSGRTPTLADPDDDETGGSTTTTTTTSATPTSTTTTTPTASRVVDRDCKDFTSQAAAQAYFGSIGGSSTTNADRLDRNRNTVACEDYKYAGTATTVPAASTSQMAVVPSGAVNTGDGSFGG